MKGVIIHEGAKVIGRERIQFGEPVIVDDFAFIYARAPVIIGNYVHIASHASITGGEVVEMGDFSALSMGARIFAGTDDFTDWGFGNSTVPEEYRNVRRAPVRVGRFCVIGANAVVLPGVAIGEGATIGANSVVTRDLEPWGVYVGNRMLRPRNKEAVLSNHARFLAELKSRG